MKQKSDSLLSKGIKKVNLAEEELMKPHNDIVSFSVCSNARSSIHLLLESYLLKHKIPFKEQESIALLLERCALNDKRFKSVDITNIDCRHTATKESYCSGVDKVNSCYNTAKKIEELVLN